MWCWSPSKDFTHLLVIKYALLESHCCCESLRPSYSHLQYISVSFYFGMTVDFLKFPFRDTGTAVCHTEGQVGHALVVKQL